MEKWKWKWENGRCLFRFQSGFRGFEIPGFCCSWFLGFLALCCNHCAKSTISRNERTTLFLKKIVVQSVFPIENGFPKQMCHVLVLFQLLTFMFGHAGRLCAVRAAASDGQAGAQSEARGTGSNGGVSAHWKHQMIDLFWISFKGKQFFGFIQPTSF